MGKKRKNKAKLYDDRGIKFDCINYDDEDELIGKIREKYK